MNGVVGITRRLMTARLTSALAYGMLLCTNIPIFRTVSRSDTGRGGIVRRISDG